MGFGLLLGTSFCIGTCEEASMMMVKSVTANGLVLREALLATLNLVFRLSTQKTRSPSITSLARECNRWVT